MTSLSPNLLPPESNINREESEGQVRDEIGNDPISSAHFLGCELQHERWGYAGRIEEITWLSGSVSFSTNMGHVVFWCDVSPVDAKFQVLDPRQEYDIVDLETVVLIAEEDCCLIMRPGICPLHVGQRIYTPEVGGYSFLGPIQSIEYISEDFYIARTRSKAPVDSMELEQGTVNVGRQSIQQPFSPP